MSRTKWILLGLAGALFLLAAYLPFLNFDYVVGRLWNEDHASESVTWTRLGLLFVGIVIIVAVAEAWISRRSELTRRGVMWFLVALAAFLAAVYLPHLRVDDLVGWLWGGSAEDADKTEAVRWMRWGLVFLAVLILFLAIRSLWLELGLVAFASLIIVASAGATREVLSRLDNEGDEPKEAAAFDRGFMLPAAKVQQLPRSLERDRCITIVLVKAVDRDSSDEKTLLAYETTVQSARLVSALKEGKPSADIEVEVGEGARAEPFAADLTAATSIFLLSTEDDQKAESQAAGGCG